jgi:hypothetical protein
MDFEEHVRLRFGVETVVVRCLGLDADSRVRIEQGPNALDLSRADLTELTRVLARILAPLPPLGRPEPPPEPGRPARQGAAWDAVDDRAVEVGWAEGRTVKQLATDLGRTTGAVAARLVRLGLEPTRDAVRDASRGRAMRQVGEPRSSTPTGDD